LLVDFFALGVEEKPVRGDVQPGGDSLPQLLSLNLLWELDGFGLFVKGPYEYFDLALSFFKLGIHIFE
jgi:hypothetical protein